MIEFAEADLVAALAIQRLCPSDEIDYVLRNLLSDLPVRGMKAVPPFVAVNHLVGDDIKAEIIEIDNPEEQWNENRKRFIGQLGERFAREQRNPIVVYVLSECWAKTWPREDRPKGRVDLRLEEVKREVVMLVALTIDGRAGMTCAEIQRDDQGLMSGLGEIMQISCGSRQENGESAAQADILKPFFRAYLQARFGARDA